MAARTPRQVQRNVRGHRPGKGQRLLRSERVAGLPQCITSADFVARQDDILAMLRDVHWDLVIFDEAHKMAASRF